MDGWIEDTILRLQYASHIRTTDDDGWVIIKGCVQWNPFTIEKEPRLKWVPNQGPQDQPTSAKDTELPGFRTKLDYIK